MDRDALLTKSILQQLERCQGYLLPEASLFQAVNLSVAPPATRSEFDRRMSALDADGYIAGTTNRLGGDRRWVITDKGLVALPQM